MVIVFLATGFEEIEALATVDVLRRAGLVVTTVGVGGRTIMGAHGIAVEADMTDAEPLPPISEWQAVVLPGGLPGTTNLEASPVVKGAVLSAAQNGLLVCAICAAPSVLGKWGLLKGRRATCYPGYEEKLESAIVLSEGVVSDGDRITAKGAGVTIEFALRIVAALVSPEKAGELGEAMQCR